MKTCRVLFFFGSAPSFDFTNLPPVPYILVLILACKIDRTWDTYMKLLYKLYNHLHLLNLMEQYSHNI